MKLDLIFNHSHFDQYKSYLKSQGLSPATINRKLSSLSTFQKYLVKKGLIQSTPAPSFDKEGLSQSPLSKGDLEGLKPTIDNLRPKFLNRYLLFTLVFLLLAGLGYGLYTQVIQKANKNLAYSSASSPATPGRVLSFQGRLTDSAGDPIATTVPIEFKFYDTGATNSGNLLYDSWHDYGTGIGSTTVTPDTNGVFSVTIGQSHGSPIPASVFSEHTAVYLEITAGGETMSPRQQIATVGYALNSETLQGLTIGTSGVALHNNVLVLDDQGNLNLGDSGVYAPAIKATNASLGIEGQSVLLKASDGSGGSITINPDANGTVNLVYEGTTPAVGGFLSLTNANMASGDLINAAITNDNRGYNFINLQNYTIGTSTLATRFSVDAFGNTLIGATLSTSNISIGNTLITASADNLNFLTGLNSSNGSILINNGSNITNLPNGSSGQVLVSSGVGATPTWVTASSVGSSYTATNGITIASGNNIQLGGSLIQNTRLNIGNTEVMYFDYATGNVGIGTTYTRAKLDVKGPIFSEGIQNRNAFVLDSAGVNYGFLTNNSTGNWSLGYGTNINTLGTSVLSWNSSGNIGIGTTSQTHQLEIVGSPADYLGYFYNSGTGPSNNGLYLRTDGTGNILTINSNGSDLLTVSPTQTTINNPVNFTSAGDVSMAYDLYLTNQTASYIKGQGPMYIQTESPTGNLDLTLSAANSGRVIIDDNSLITGNLNVGGTLILPQGATTGYVLQSDASGNASWVSATGIGGTYTAGSGLTLSGSQFQFGGPITQNTRLNIGNTEVMYIDYATGKIGIGTTNPQNTLHIAGSTAELLQLQRTGTAPASWSLRSSTDVGTAAGSLIIQNNNAGGDLALRSSNSGNAQMVLLNNGYVGIGTTNPTKKFEINGTSGLQRWSYPDVAGNDIYRLDLDTVVTSGNVRWVFNQKNSSNIYNNALVFDRGNIGIGTSSANYKLDLSGDLNLTGTIYTAGTSGVSGQVLTSTGASLAWINAASIGTSYGATNGLSIIGTSIGLGGTLTQNTRLNIGNTEVMYIDYTTGNIGFGTTATNTYKLNVNGTANFTGTISNSHNGLSTTFLSMTDTQTSGVSYYIDNGYPSAGIFGIRGPTGTNIAINNGNVGIGTTSPGAKLDITSSATNDWIRINPAGGTINRNGNFYLQTNSTNQITMLTSGLVGIGTTSPNYKLDLSGDLNLTGTVYTAGTSGTLGQILTSTGSGLAWVNSASVGQTFAVTNGLQSISNNVFGLGGTLTQNTQIGLSSSTFSFVGSSQTTTISPNGYVGIGNTNPTYPLTVGGNSYFNGFGTFYRGPDNSTANLQIGGEVIRQYSTASPIRFQTGVGSSDVLTIAASGNVGIGTTNPGAKLSFGSNVGEAIRLYETSTAIYGLGVNNSEFQSYIPTSAHFSFNSGNGIQTSGTNELMRITGTGNVGIGTTAPTHKLELTGNTNDYLGYVYNVGTSANSAGLYLRTDGSGNILTLNSNGSDIVTVSPTQATFNVPTNFSSSGDVSIAYDLLFTNPTSSSIKSQSPLTISAGEVYNSSNLTLQTFNNGALVLDTPGGVNLAQAQNWILGNGTTSVTALNIQNGLFNLDSTNNRVGIGTSSPIAKLDVAGDLNLTGTILTTGTSGANGQILQSTGTGLAWINAASIGTSYGATNGLSIIGTNIGLGGALTQNTRLNIGNTEVMYIDASTGNIGIGTTGQLTNTKLLVSGGAVAASNFWGNTFGSYGYNALDTDIKTSSNTNIKFINSTTEVMRIGASGNVGIGTSSPAAKLDIYSNLGTIPLKVTQNANESATPALATFYTTNGWLGTIGAGGSNTFSIASVASKNLALGAGGSERIRLDASGNVGIGTTSPQYNLDLVGNINLTGTIYTAGTSGVSGQILQSTGTGLAWINPASIGTSFGATNGLSIIGTNVGLGGSLTQNTRLNIGNTEVMYIDASTGRIGIGTTNPQHTLDISGSVNLSNTQAYRIKDAGGVSRIVATIDNNSLYKYAFDGSGNPSLTINSTSGNVGIGTTAPGSYKLNVNGNTNIGGTLTLPQGASNGYILQSDASGNASWVSPTSSGIGTTYAAGIGLTLSSGNIFSLNLGSTNTWTALQTFSNGIGVSGLANLTNSLNVGATINTANLFTTGFVGIGTTAPTSMLYIAGNGSTGNLFTINDGTQDIFNVTSAQTSINNPASFTSAGDVSLAYDLNFNNPIASSIKSQSALTLQAGEPFSSSNLTLSTYNNGQIVLDSNGVTLNQPQTWTLATGSTNALSLGNIATIDTLNNQVGISGNLNLTGTILTAGTSGTSGQLLQSTGAGLQWINVSAVGQSYSAGNGINISGANVISNTGLLSFNGGTGAFTLNAGNSDIGVSTTGSTTSLYNLATLDSVTARGASTNNAITIGTTITTNNLFASGKIGIGTTSPSEKLDITTGNIRLSNDYTLGFGNGGESLTGSSANHNLRFNVNSSEKMRIDLNGNVGIGTTNPGYPLEVAGNIAVKSTSGTKGLLIYNGSSLVGGMQWSSANSKTAIFDNTGNVALTLDSGNIGIGTTSPTQKLDINGSLNLTGTIYTAGTSGVSGQILQSTGSGLAWINPSATGIGTTYDANNGITKTNNVFQLGGTITQNTRLNIGNTEVMYINGTTGNIGIGTTNPIAQLHLSSGAIASDTDFNLRSNSSFNFMNQAGTNYRASINSSGQLALYNGSNSTYIAPNTGMQMFYGSTSTVVINPNGSSYLNGGRLGIGTTSPGTKLDVYTATDTIAARVVNERTTGSPVGFYTQASGIGGTTNIGLQAFAEGATNNIDLILGNTSSPAGFYSLYAPSVRNNYFGGSLGIGISAPTQKLDVNGNINLTGTILSAGTSGTNGQVLSSTGTGLQWINAASIGTSYGATNGLSIIGTSIGLGGTLTQNTQIGLSSSTFSFVGSTQTTTILPNGYIGVGTSSPIYSVDANGYIRAANGFITSSAYGLVGPGVAVRGSNDSYLNITAGNVGIGTTSPTQKLDISGSLNLTGTIYTAGTSGVSGQILQSTGSGLAWINPSATGIGTTYDANNGITKTNNVFQLGGAITQNTRLNIGNTEVMYINSTNGYVGIGTTSPRGSLDLPVGTTSYFGNLTLDSNNRLTANGTDLGLYGETGTGIFTKNSSWSRRAYFDTNGNVGLGGSITSTSNLSGANLVIVSGNVGIGTTSPGSNMKLDVNGNLRLNGGIYGYNTTFNYISPSGSGASGFNMDFYTRTAGASGAQRFTIEGGSAIANAYFLNSNVGIGTSSPQYNLDLVGNLNLTGTIYTAGTSGVSGQILQSTGTGLAWVNPSTSGIGTTYAAGVGLTLSTGNVFSLNLGSTNTWTALQTFNNGLNVGTTINTVNLFTTGNVGIGTTNPGYKLEVNGNAHFTGAVYGDSNLSVTGTNKSAIFSPYANTADLILRLNDNNYNFSFQGVGGTPLATIQGSTGNVGIGTTTPGSYKLNVNGNANIDTNLTIGGTLTLPQGAVSGYLLTSDASGNASWTNANASGIGTTYDANNGITKTAGNIFQLGGAITQNTRLNIGNTEVMYIDSSSGFVGIGTTNPIQPLEVAGNVAVFENTSTDHSIGFNYQGNSAIYRGMTSRSTNAGSGYLLKITNSSNGNATPNIIFGSSTGGTADAMTVNVNTGFVGIGTTVPLYKLQVNGEGVFTKLGVGGTSNNGLFINALGLGVTGDSTFSDNLSIGKTLSAATLNVLNAATTTMVTSLNADLLDGHHATDFQSAGNYDNYQYWTANVGTSNLNVGSTTQLTFATGAGLAATLVGNTLTLTNTSLGTTYTSGVGLTLSSGNIFSLTNTGVTAATYGAGTSIPQITVDAQGRITSATQSLANFQSPLSFTNGISQVGNTVSLGGTLNVGTSIALNSNNFMFTGTGNIGIGTTNPTKPLDVYGQANVSGLLTAGQFNTTTDGTVATVFYDTAITNPSASAYARYFHGGNTFTDAATSRWIGFNSAVGWTGKFTEFDVNNDKRFSVDESGNIYTKGSIGIGTTAPTQKLDVNGNINLTGTILSAGASGSSGQILSSTGSGLAWINAASAGQTYTSGVGLTLSSGNIFNINLGTGITTNASNQLSLTTTGVTAATYGSGTSIPQIAVDANGRITSASNILANFESPLTFNNGLTRTGNTIGLGGTLTANTQIGTSSFNLSFVGLGNTQSLYIASTGNVGIGTTAPKAKLDIGGYFTPVAMGTTTSFPAVISDNVNDVSGIEMGNTNTGAAADFRFAIFDTTGNYTAFAVPSVGNASSTLLGQARSSSAFIFNNGGTARNLTIGTVAAKDLIFGTNNTEQMRLTSTGSIGIGTTAPGSYKLNVNGNTNIGGTLTLPQGAAAGRLLISDASGNASWTSATGAGIGTTYAAGVGLSLSSGNIFSLNLGSTNTWTAPQTFANINVTGTILSAGASGSSGQILSSTGSGLAWISAASVGTSFGAANGLSISGNNIGLGGTVTANTNIDVSSSYLSFFGNSHVPSLYISANGNVGVGNTTAGTKLDVWGNIRSSQTATSYSQFSHANAGGDATYPRSYFLGYGNGTINNYGLYAASGNATGATYVPAFFGVSNSSNVTTAGSKQLVMYTTSNMSGIMTFTGENAGGGAGTDLFLGGSSLTGSDAPVWIKTGGNIGLGNANPAQKLDITGSLNLTGTIYTAGTSGVSGQLLSSTGAGLAWINASSIGTTYAAGVGLTLSSGKIFSLAASGVTAATYGTGTSIPQITVDAYGRITSATNILASFESPLTFNNGLTRTGNTIGLGGTLTANTQIGTSSFSLSFLGLGGTPSLYLGSLGYIGIGTTSPLNTLEVNGNGYFSGNLALQGNYLGSLTTGSLSFGRRLLTQNSLDLTSSTIGANWTQANGTSREYSGLAMSADGKYQTAVVYGSGMGQGIYTSTNYGVTWTQADSTARAYTSIAMSSDGRYQTAVITNSAAGQGIYTSTNYGVTWTQADSTARMYNTIAMSTDGKYQIAGVLNNGGIYGSTNYGVTWTQIYNSNSFWSVAMSSDGRYQTAVTNSNYIYSSTNYGTTWTQVDNNTRNYRSVAMSADGKYQTATVYGNSAGQGIYISTNYGVTWTQSDSTARNYESVAMSADGKYQTATGDSTSGINISTNYGASWTQIDSTARDYWAVAMSADGKYQTAVIWDGPIYTSTAASFIAGGNFGIGTTNPLYKLDVNGNLNLTGTILSAGTSGAAGQLLSSTGTGLQWISPLSLGSTFAGTNNYLSKFVGSTGLTASSIYDNGKIGINTTNPYTKFDILGNQMNASVYAVGVSLSQGIGVTNVTLGSGFSFPDEAHAVGKLIVRTDGSFAPIVGYYDPSNVYVGTTVTSTYNGVATIYNANFYVDATNNRVGINTVAPRTAFEVNGNMIADKYSDTTSWDSYYLDPAQTAYLQQSSLSLALTGSIRFGATYDIGNSFWRRLSNNTSANAASQILNLGNGLLLGVSTVGATNTDIGSAWNSQLFLNTNGNVGIGLTNPNSKLDINGNLNVATTITTSNLYSTGSVAAGTTSPYFLLQASSSSAATGLASISTAGLGTTSGGAIFAGNTNFPTAAELQIGSLNFAANNGYSAYATAASIQSFSSAAWSAVSGKHSADLRFFTSPDSLIGTSAAERLRITAAGLVGIGTTNPLATLDINGNLNVATTTTTSNLYTSGSIGIGTTAPISALSLNSTLGNKIDLWQDGTNRYGFGVQSNLLQTYVPYTTASFAWGTGNSTSFSELMRLTGTGFLGLGTTTPASKLEIDGSGNLLSIGDTAGNNLFTITDTQINNNLPTSFNAAGDVAVAYDLNFTNQVSSNINSNGPLSLTAGERWESNDLTLKTYNAGNLVINSANLWADGTNFGIGTTAPGYKLTVNGQPAANGYTAFTNYSDARLKTNIQQLSSGYLDKIMALKPSTFNYNDLTGYDAQTKSRLITGFIAQDLQAVFPDMVGKSTINGTEYLDTNLSALPIYLVKAIQEQQAQIGDLSLTSDGQVYVDSNIDSSVLTSLGYNQLLTAAQTNHYSLKDSLGNIVNKIGSFSQLTAAKINTGFLSAQTLVTKLTISDTSISKTLRTDVISPLSDAVTINGNVKITGDITSTNATVSSLTASDIAATNASISGTLYADTIVSKDGNIADVMTAKVTDLRTELQTIIDNAFSSSNTLAPSSTNSALLAEASSWINIASDSAQLSGNLSLIGNMVIGSQLIVTGNTQLSNALITGTLSAGDIAIKDNMIDTTATALYIQPSKTGTIHLMGDTVTIADTGDVVINGNLAVNGQLTAQTASVSGNLFANLIAVNEIGASKATIDDLTSAKLNIATDSATPIIADAGFAQLATTSAQLSTNASAGTATLPAGKTELIINSSKLTANSLVYLTPNGSTQNQVVYVKNKITATLATDSATPASSSDGSHFTIAIDAPLTQDLEINWWIVN